MAPVPKSDGVRPLRDTAALEPSDPLEVLIRAQGFDELEPARALNELGRLIDAANNQQLEAGLVRATELAERLRGRIVVDANPAILDYYEGNAWAGLDAIRHGAEPWAWERPELEREITCLRRAAQVPRASGKGSPVRGRD